MYKWDVRRDGVNECHYPVIMLPCNRERINGTAKTATQMRCHDMWQNSDTDYGVVSKFLHWLIAVAIYGLFALGSWMVNLTYYDSWYIRGPNLHRSLGVLLMVAMAIRVFWIILTGKPKALDNHQPWETGLSRVTHLMMYVLVFIIGLTGYLITTADGRSVDVFHWFSLPSSGEWIENQEDVAGEFHKYLAYGLIFVSVIHGLAALKHHLLDKDRTLRRML